jgi:hypothetical protein
MSSSNETPQKNRITTNTTRNLFDPRQHGRPEHGEVRLERGADDANQILVERHAEIARRVLVQRLFSNVCYVER